MDLKQMQKNAPQAVTLLKAMAKVMGMGTQLSLSFVWFEVQLWFVVLFVWPCSMQKKNTQKRNLCCTHSAPNLAHARMVAHLLGWCDDPQSNPTVPTSVSSFVAQGPSET